MIEEVTERAHGRERWWRTIPVDHREPDYDWLSAQEKAALDGWRAGQIPAEVALVNRFIADVRKHGGWAKASRASGYYTAEDLEAFFDEYTELLNKYGHPAQDAPPGARLMQLRMFYIPDEPADRGPERAWPFGVRGPPPPPIGGRAPSPHWPAGARRRL